MENKKYMVLNMEAYMPPDPTETVVNNLEWVKYGADNAYLDYLLARFYGSPTNNAIITGVADMIVGGGLMSPVQVKRPDSYAKAKVMFKDEDVRRWAFDLKFAGYYLIQVIQTKSGFTCKHTPVENWRSGIADENGDIKFWFYSDNWAKWKDSKYKPEPYPVYEKGTKKQITIKVVKPFRAGTFYYPSPDYVGALAYAHLEQEIATFHLNNVLNGFVAGHIINMNNGDPGDGERDKIVNDIKSKLTGAHNAGKIIVAFNDNKETAATIESIQVSDLDKQFQFLSTEAQGKIMVGHRIVSPLLFGIRDSSGLGNNAQELTEAYKLFNAVVLEPYRRILTESFEELLSDSGYTLPLRFEDNKFFVAAQKQELSHEHPDMSEDDERVWLEHLDKVGERIDPDEWDMVLEEAVDTHGMTLEADALDGNPAEKSKEDTKTGLYKVRYAYSPPRTQSDSRQFCKAMVTRAQAGTVYRKEDILKMQAAGVNAEFSAKGESNYSIWLYKGGVNCHHYWNRRVYFRKRGPGGQFLPASDTDSMENDQQISVARAKSAGANIKPNEPEVPIAPINMPNQGRKS